MNPDLREALLWASMVGAVLFVLAAALRCFARAVARSRDRGWQSQSLQNAELAFSEKSFVAKTPFVLGAKVDRAYRLNNGMLVLAEFKSRSQARVYASDTVELSVQKVAMEGTGVGRVANVGYVVTQHPRTGERMGVPVKLLNREALVDLARRYRAVVSGEVVPRRVNQAKICGDCPYQRECRPTGGMNDRGPVTTSSDD